MKTILKRPRALVLASLLLLAASACTTNVPTNTTQPTSPNTANANASASPSATPAATNASASSAALNLPVTLPVLDAMFADESFAGELKSKLQLSDEQIARLRQVAREGTSELIEEGAETGTRSEATRRGSEKIKDVLGDEIT